MMISLYTFLRGLVAFFGFTVFLSLMWFSDSLSGMFTTAGILMGLSSILVALLPKRMLSGEKVRLTMITFCMIGVLSGFVLIADDLSSEYGIEWDVIVIRLVHIVALGALAIIAVRKRGLV